MAIRLFLTCWMVYALHFATNTVREIYPALALADHFSFRLDEYAGLHPDIFEKEGYGWHISGNIGVSMIAAIPYALARPLVDSIVEIVQQKRAGLQEPPSYESPWPKAQAFYREAWTRGLDVKFGLAAFLMQAFCMAPISALGVVAMFWLLSIQLQSQKTALWLALLFAFGTPVFFRTGTLNHNLMLGHFAFFGFLALWNPSNSERWSEKSRYVLGGVAGGAAILLDYSGFIFLTGLFIYGIAKSPRFRNALWYAVGATGPLFLLWFYQWKAFGHPFYAPQHHMPPQNAWVQMGYQGFSWPKLDLFAALAFDYRYGLFLSCPLMLLAFFLYFARNKWPRRELITMIAFSLAFWIFFSCVNFTRLQFNTGIRYLTAILPFLFIPAALVLLSLPRKLALLIGTFSVFQSWCLAMYRDVERGYGLAESLLQVFLGGFRLPALTTLWQIEQYRAYFPFGPSPLPLFAFTAAILSVIWFRPKIVNRNRALDHNRLNQEHD